MLDPNKWPYIVANFTTDQIENACLAIEKLSGNKRLFPQCGVDSQADQASLMKMRMTLHEIKDSKYPVIKGKHEKRAMECWVLID